MDPLSVCASAIAVVTVASQVGAVLMSLRVRADLKGRLRSIKNEISDLGAVLNHTVSILQERKAHNIVHDSLATIASVLTRIHDNLKKLNKIASRLTRQGSSPRDRLITTTIWLRERSRLDALLKELQDLKATLTMCLGTSNLHDSTHIRLDLRRISVITEDASEYRPLFEAASRRLSTGQESIDRTIYQHQQHMNARFDRLDELCMQQMAMIRHFQTAQTDASAGSHQPRSRFPGMQVQAAQYNGPVCKSWCPCACHTRDKIKTPKLLDRFLGELFIGYAGLPLVTRSCDKSYCERKQAPFMTIDYWFPSWWTSHIVKTVMAYQPLAGPQMSITTLRRVPEASTCFDLAGKGDIEGVKALIIADMTSTRDVGSKTGYTMLTCAIIKRQSRMAEFLLEAGSDPHHDPSGIQPTPSALAWDLWLRGVVPRGDELALRPLLNRSDFVDDQNFSTVHKIVLGLSFKDLDQELANNPQAPFEVDAQGRTALSWAAARGDARSAAKLIACGADANALDKHGKSPLYLTVNSEHKTQNACVRVLLEGGAETDRQLYNSGVVRSTPLLCAANEADDILVLKSLLDYGANLEATNRAGATPLIIVARSKPVHFAALLLAYGANLHATDNEGNTVLTTAIKHNNHDVLRMLLDRWFRYTASPRSRKTDVLHAAAASGDLETMQILAVAGEWGFRPDAQNSSGLTAQGIMDQRRDRTDQLGAAFKRLVRAVHGKKTDVDELQLLEAGLLRPWTPRQPRRDSLVEDLKLFEVVGTQRVLLSTDELAIDDSSDDEDEDSKSEIFEEAVESLAHV